MKQKIPKHRREPYLVPKHLRLQRNFLTETRLLFRNSSFAFWSLWASGESIFPSSEERWRRLGASTGRAVSHLIILQSRWGSHVKEASIDADFSYENSVLASMFTMLGETLRSQDAVRKSKASQRLNIACTQEQASKCTTGTRNRKIKAPRCFSSHDGAVKGTIVNRC